MVSIALKMAFCFFHTSACRKYDKDHSLKLEKDELQAFLAELNGGRAPKASSRFARRKKSPSAFVLPLSSRCNGMAKQANTESRKRRLHARRASL